MGYMGRIKRNATCAICKKAISTGELVMFDSSKSHGNHLAHAECYIDLVKDRKKYKWPGKDIKSSEELDPPF